MTPQSTEYLTLNQVAKRFPGKSGGRIHTATITRWILMGCLSRDGVRVKLSATRVGSRWLVDPSNLDIFFAALAGNEQAPEATHMGRTAEQRNRASEHAARELERRGA